MVDQTGMSVTDTHGDGSPPRFQPGRAWIQRHRAPLPNVEALALALVQDLHDEGKIENWFSNLRVAVAAELARDKAEAYRRAQE